MGKKAREKRETLIIPNSTQFPNVLLDRVMRVCSPGVFKVIACICRQTFGWQKKWEAISITTVMEMTGLSNRFVIDSLESLVDSSIVERGTETEYGYEYKLNENPSIERAIELLKQAERPARQKPSGGRKKSANADESAAAPLVNPVHQPGEPSSPAVDDEPSSPVAMNPVHLKPVNPVHTSKPTSTKPTFQTKEERPLSENVRTIAQSKFFRELETLPIRKDFDPDKDSMCRIRIAALKSGFGLTNAKEALSVHPDWWTWPYLEFIDSQTEINFPAAPKAQKAAQEFQPPSDWNANGALEVWRTICQRCEKQISKHSFETWFKPLRADGLRAGVLYVRVPTHEFSFISDKYGDVIQAAMDEIADGPKEVQFVTSDQLASYDFGEKATA